MLEPVAAIDCGSNSTRLLVTDGFETFERQMRITRLGAGVDASGLLSSAAISRSTSVLEEFRLVLDSYDVKRVRSIATSAVRDAENKDEFLDTAEKILGIRPELLTGVQEGRLSFRGATEGLDPEEGPFLVLDIGGGSTEFVLGTTEVEGIQSCDIGCVGLTEQWVDHDPPLPEELLACLSVAEAHIAEVIREIPEITSARKLVGLAGTVSCVAAVEQGLANYDRDLIHHFTLKKDAVEDVFRTLSSESQSQRLENPGMEEGRADVILGGLCVLVKVMRQLKFEECLVSEEDILDGLAASQLDA